MKMQDIGPEILHGLFHGKRKRRADGRVQQRTMAGSPINYCFSVTRRPLFLTDFVMNQRGRRHPAPFKGWKQVPKKTLDAAGYRREKFPDMQDAHAAYANSQVSPQVSEIIAIAIRFLMRTGFLPPIYLTKREVFQSPIKDCFSGNARCSD